MEKLLSIITWEKSSKTDKKFTQIRKNLGNLHTVFRCKKTSSQNKFSQNLNYPNICQVNSQFKIKCIKSN